MSLLICLFLMFFSASGLHAEDGKQTINLICMKNRTGLGKHNAIFTEELTALGYQVNQVDPADQVLPYADINFFLERFNSNHVSYADKNYILPHPDCCWLVREDFKHFDKILCATEHAVKIFQAFHPDVTFIGLTSVDKQDISYAKNYNKFFHSQSTNLKGTQTIFDVWRKRPDFPQLTVIKQFGQDGGPGLPNVKFINKYLPDNEFSSLQNVSGFHLCPSETEGYGHYIMEAMSAGAVVITTDAPPMNEFIQDPRCLVRYYKTEPHAYATKYLIDPLDLERVIVNLLSLPEEELQEIGAANRKAFEDNLPAFRARLREVFPPQND